MINIARYTAGAPVNSHKRKSQLMAVEEEIPKAVLVKESTPSVSSFVLERLENVRSQETLASESITESMIVEGQDILAVNPGKTSMPYPSAEHV